MTEAETVAPTLAAARERIAAVQPEAYARTRNAIDGAVSRLSPYITHGYVSLPEVLAGVAARHPLHVQHKFVYELGWRAFFRHVWQHQGEGILQSLHTGVLPDAAYARELPADIREARTGLAVIDQAVRTLYATGTLHNHARMWLASYVVHLRKLHWRTGADWMFGHLLDGDLASNHLSWQWVAGTGSSKPYLFNAENVARYAPADWHGAGSLIDTSYEALDAMARSPRPIPVRPTGDGVEEPLVSSLPPTAGTSAGTSAGTAQPAEVAGRDVWLVHPWSLGEAPTDLPAGALLLGWWPADFHAAWPWSTARWTYTGARMAQLCNLQWVCSAAQLEGALAGANSVQALADPHISASLPACVRQRAPLALFPEVRQPCASFSSWWNRSTRGLRTLAELPGLQALQALQSAQVPQKV